MQEYLRQLKIYIKDIAKLALPITTAFVAMGLMGIIDTMIVGNYNTDQLAYIGLANSIFVVLFTIPIGLLQGVLIKSSQKFGAHKFQSTGKIYNEGRKYSFILAIVFTLLGIQGETILRLLGQDDDMVKHGGEVLRVFVFSIPFILMYVNANFFLQSIRRPYVGMYGIIAANILNIIVNPVLVYGKFGFPELGAVGSATSTLIVRIFLAVYILAYIRRMKKNPKLNKRFGLDRSYSTWWNDSRRTRKIGYGIAIMTIATNGSFSIVSTFAGWMGQHTMATFVIMINVSTLLFMICFSISQATSIVVANAYGCGDRKGILMATNAGYVISLTTIITLITILYSYPDQVFGIFTNDPSVISVIKGLLFFVLADLFIDALPLNINGALNGRGDVKIPTLNQVISFLGVRVSACYFFAFTLDMGLKGLPIGLACGGLSSLILNTLRFGYLAHRDKKEGLH